MTIDAAELRSWFLARPKWLQDAARRLFHAGQLTAADLKELLTLCKREAKIIVDGHPDITPQEIPAAAFNLIDISQPLSIDVISDVKAINGLSPRKPLTFDKEKLTIIFGSNGSGKSGYIRVLKHTCGGKGIRPLHPNVFAKSMKTKAAPLVTPSATTKKKSFGRRRSAHYDDLRNMGRLR